MNTQTIVSKKVNVSYNYDYTANGFYEFYELLLRTYCDPSIYPSTTLHCTNNYARCCACWDIQYIPSQLPLASGNGSVNCVKYEYIRRPNVTYNIPCCFV